MDPTTRYELRPGEWRPDPPRVSYGCDRTRLVELLGDEQSAMPWTQGESESGPAISVQGRTIECPPTADDLEWLTNIARPAPYGRGERTLLDPAVRDALQIGADQVTLQGEPWERLRASFLEAVAADMGLADADLVLEPLKLLVYGPGGHFAEHADTEKTPGMVASLALILPGPYEGGALAIEHGGERLTAGRGGSPLWRWAAWYADCRHRLEAVESGVRIALTFAIAVDPEKPLTERKARSRDLGRAFWERSYAEWHTAWAARAGRERAGNEQYGQKLVWALSHRYTEPGLRASLLKGRDRELARVLLGELRGEACYLGWLQIREVGSARTPQGALWGDDTFVRHEPDDSVEDHDLPPDSVMRMDWKFGESSDPAPMRIVHKDTPELHLDMVSRQNVWIEGLRALDGEDVDHGPIEVLDGEIAPTGALADAVPDGARLYEMTGNEGASIEFQYRRAVLVVWRRNEATLRMLAQCGGRLGLAVELSQRSRDTSHEHSRAGGVEEVLELWPEALATDGGGPEPRAHRLLLDAMDKPGLHDDYLRDRYVERVARVDLEAEAVPTLVEWLRERLKAGNPSPEWTDALRAACAKIWFEDAASGAPAFLRALCEEPELQALLDEVLPGRSEDLPARERALRHADAIDERLAERAWRRRRIARMTIDDAKPQGREGHSAR